MTTSNQITPITLDPRDLLSKWGFEDGDLGGEQLHAWASNGPYADDYPDESDETTVDHPLGYYLSQRTLLLRLVDRHLAPLLPAYARLYRIGTVHNPIRVEPVLHEDSPEYQDACSDLEAFLDGLDPIELDAEEIARTCEQLFPPRSRGWFALYRVLWHCRTAMAEFRASMNDLQDIYESEPVIIIEKFIEGLSTSHTDDELFLAAETLSSGRTLDHSLDEVHYHLRSSKVLLKH